MDIQELIKAAKEHVLTEADMKAMRGRVARIEKPQQPLPDSFYRFRYNMPN